MDHVTRATPLSELVRRLKANTWYSLQAHKIWRLSLQPFQKYFRECEILECVMWRWPRPLRGQLVTWRLVILVAKPCTKFDICSFSRPKDILWGKILKMVTWSRPRPFQGRLVVRMVTFDIACNHTKFDDSSFSHSRDILGVWNSSMSDMALTTVT